MHRHAFLGLVAFVAVPAVVSCSSTSEGPGKRDPYPTEEALCAAWAVKACSTAIVEACAAADTEACAASAAAFCEQSIPSEAYSSKDAKICLTAVEAAFKDGKLDLEEYRVAIGFEDDCRLVDPGAGVEGDSCRTDGACDTTKDFACVRALGASEGTCQVPEIVGGGFKCEGVDQVCDEPFYCDGKNCLARPADPGAACAETMPCAADFQCLGELGAETCVAKAPVSGDCATHDDCVSRLCLLATGGGGGVCVSMIDFSPTSEICTNFR